MASTPTSQAAFIRNLRGIRAVWVAVVLLTVLVGSAIVATADTASRTHPTDLTVPPRQGPSSPVVGVNRSANTSNHAANPRGAPYYQVPGGWQPGHGGFNALSCVSATTCVAVGANDLQVGKVSLSDDGGMTWRAVALPSGTPQLNGVSCASRRFCVAVGDDAMLSSDNGGTTWTVSSLANPKTTMTSVGCWRSGLCLATGIASNPTGPASGVLLRSSDDGRSWTDAAPSLNPGGLEGVACATPSDCVVVGQSLLQSTDGGVTWVTRNLSGGTQTLTSVSCMSTTTCVAVGVNPLATVEADATATAVVTRDGGNTWAALAMPAGSGLVDQVSCSNGVGCVASGLISNTTQPAPVLTSVDAQSWTMSTPTSGLTSVADLFCQGSVECVGVGRTVNGSAGFEASAGTAWLVTPAAGFTPVHGLGSH